MLDVRRRHVLAGRVDDDLFLAVDDRDVAVGVDLRHVARVQPAVRVDRLRRSRRVVAVALHHQRRAHQQFAVVEELELYARQCATDRAEPYVRRRVDRGEARRLRHAPTLVQHDAKVIEEPENFRGCRGGAADAEVRLVEAHARAHRGLHRFRQLRRRLEAGRLDRALDLLPHPGNGAERRRPHFRQHRADLPVVRDVGDRTAEAE